jgi:hypothetical protein
MLLNTTTALALRARAEESTVSSHRGGRRRGVEPGIVSRRRERAARWTVAHLLLNEAGVRTGRLQPGEVVSLELLGDLIASKLPWRVDRPLDKSLVSKYERGLVDPDADVVAAYVDVLRDFGVCDVSEAWITYGTRGGAKPPRHPFLRGGFTSANGSD